MTVKDRLLYTTKTDDRSRMRAVANNLILHLHPTKVAKPALRFSYTWGLGGISTTLGPDALITGVLLMFRYDASVERAYTSIQYLETQVLFGSLIRAHAPLVGQFADRHRLFTLDSRLFYRRLQARTLDQLASRHDALLLLVVAFNFTGYLLPWDQLAFWAITVGTSLLELCAVGGHGRFQFPARRARSRTRRAA